MIWQSIWVKNISSYKRSEQGLIHVQRVSAKDNVAENMTKTTKDFGLFQQRVLKTHAPEVFRWKHHAEGFTLEIQPALAPCQKTLVLISLPGNGARDVSRGPCGQAVRNFHFRMLRRGGPSNPFRNQAAPQHWPCPKEAGCLHTKSSWRNQSFCLLRPSW